MSSLKDRIASGQLKGCYFYTYHSHQPYLVDNGNIVGNLRKMWCSGEDKDRYEARMFYQCYLNPAQKMIEAFEQGKHNAACMADFSGTLLDGIISMEREGFFSGEGKPGFVETYRRAFERCGDNLELLLIPWSHPYLDGGCPKDDIDRQIAKGLETYREVFGDDVVSKVKGLFPPELGLPSDPDVLYELIVSCNRNGLKWMLVNETSLENKDGEGVPSGYPYQLHVKNRAGEEASITVLTRVHDIYQSEGGGHAAAKSYLCSRMNNDEKKPLMIGSAGDLENGGVMMNEHWGPWLDTVGDDDGSEICPAAGTAFIEAVLAKENNGNVDWDKAEEVFDKVYSKGGSWTFSSEHWTEGENKQSLDNITFQLSEFYHEALEAGGKNHEDKWRAAERALFVIETSCYRYWGDSGDWMNAGFNLIDSAVHAINALAESAGFAKCAKLENGNLEIA